MLAKFPHLTANTVDRRGDLIDPGNGDRIEIKTSYRDIEYTDFIVELFDLYDNGTRIVPAGPWQAKAGDIRKFVWFYNHTGETHWFDNDELVEELDKIKENYLVKSGKTLTGKGWTSSYIFIPREHLQHLKSYKIYK